MSDLFSKCESPAETALLVALQRVLDRAMAVGYTLHGQYEVAPYRLDFAFVAADGRCVAVEVDGHDFHDRSVEQAAWDRKRDRFLLFAGWRVLRFTGTEVHRSAFSCATEVLLHLEQHQVGESTAKLRDDVARAMIRLTKNTEEKQKAKNKAFVEKRRQEREECAAEARQRL